jgi:hypothetical protein
MTMISAGAPHSVWIASITSCTFCASFDIRVTTRPVLSLCRAELLQGRRQDTAQAVKCTADAYRLLDVCFLD